MATEGRIVIFDDSVDAKTLAATPWPRGSHLLLLYWAAPDALRPVMRQTGVTCHLLLDMVGGLANWERRAAELAVALCDGGGNGGRHLDGLPWRRLVEEPLYREALEVVALYDAFALSCRLSSSPPELRLTASRRALWQALAGSEPAPTASAHTPAEADQRPSLWRRLGRRVRRVMVTGDLRGQLWNVVDQLDPDYRRRMAWNRRRPTPTVRQGGIVFFSSYLNNSHLLRIVEDNLRETPHWLVTNRYARLACAGTGGEVDDLYRFADGQALPSPGDIPPPDLAPLVATWEHQNLPPEALAHLLTAWLRQSPSWSYWQQRGQHALANLASCWLRYLELAQPRLIVMANQWSLEGWMTQLARQRGYPVLQVLHGVLSGEYYTGRPVVSDALLVAGDFWRQLWPAEQRAPIHVLRLAGTFPAVERQPQDGAPRVTYFSWPLDRLPFYNSRELLDGFIHLFQNLLAAGACQLTVRCHPLEHPADLLDRWQQLYGRLPSGLRLSHEGPVSEVIAVTDLAVMFRSTTMLDCLANGIPCLLPAWIEFTWGPQLADHPGLHLAADFADMARTLDAWLRQPPCLGDEASTPFLSATLDDGGAALRQLITELAPPPSSPSPEPSPPSESPPQSQSQPQSSRRSEAS